MADDVKNKKVDEGQNSSDEKQQGGGVLVIYPKLDCSECALWAMKMECTL